MHRGRKLRRNRGAMGVALLAAVGLLVMVGALLTSAGTSSTPQAEAAPPAVPTWTRCGGPLGGLGYDVRMSPDDPDRMLVSDGFAGLFASDDGGDTWYPSNTGITVRTGISGDAIPVFSVTIDPHDPDIVWAGTQYLRGIFRSDDGGDTWTKTDDGVIETDGITFRGFTVDPRSSTIVYAAAEISSWQWNNGVEDQGRGLDLTKGVVYKTVDGGKNWKAVWRGDSLARYIWINPSDPDVLYVSTGIFDREAANSDPNDPSASVPGGEGIIKSTDGGKTWRHINNGIENLYVGTLFMHPENPDILLAAGSNNTYVENPGVYLTTNGGESWKCTLHEAISSVEFSLSDPRIAYAAGQQAVYRSEDGGRSWDRLTGTETGWGPPGVVAGFPIDLQIDPRDPDRVFANAYGGGNFLSADGGRTWTIASTGYTGAQARDVVVDPSAPGRVLVAARSGVFVSLDGGTAWQGLSTWPEHNMEWSAVAIDPTDPHHILGTTQLDGYIAESHDDGRSWVQRGTMLKRGFCYSALVFSPSDTTTVYAGTAGCAGAGQFSPELPGRGVLVSHDGGATWSPVNDTLSAAAHVTMLAVHPSDPQTVYASTTRGVLRTTSGGSSWQQVNGLSAGTAFKSVAVSPHDPRIVYAGTYTGLYRSDDGAVTWSHVMQGFAPESVISDVVFDPLDARTIYASDLASGVYRTQDGGSLWTPVNQGLRMRAVNRLAISSDGKHLYAATEGEGVFRLDVDGTPPKSASQPPPVFADVGEGAPGYAAILGLYARDIVGGYAQPTGPPFFKPSNPVLRAQFAKMLCGVLGFPVDEQMQVPFTDLGADDPNNLYPHEYVAFAAETGIARGLTPTTFAPYKNITRAQLMTMVVRAATTFAGLSAQDPPDEYYHAGRLAGFQDPNHGHNAHLAEWNGFLEGIDLRQWDPWAAATRSEAAQMLWNLYKLRQGR